MDSEIIINDENSSVFWGWSHDKETSTGFMENSNVKVAPLLSPFLGTVSVPSMAWATSAELKTYLMAILFGGKSLSKNLRQVIWKLLTVREQVSEGYIIIFAIIK